MTSLVKLPFCEEKVKSEKIISLARYNRSVTCVKDPDAQPRLTHEHFKNVRNKRLAQGNYAVVQKPVLLKTDPFFTSLPTYKQSKQTLNFVHRILRSSATEDLNLQNFSSLDLRCFYTGIVCDPYFFLKNDYNPRTNPWVGTKDHLVPLRRDVLGVPHDSAKIGSTTVFTSYIVNTVFGLCPMLVRLKIREWLQTAKFSRDDHTIANSENVKWLIISMLDDFRWKGRYPWSRDPDGNWWDAEFSQPFMQSMWKSETEFLNANDDERELLIKKFKKWNY